MIILEVAFFLGSLHIRPNNNVTEITTMLA